MPQRLPWPTRRSVIRRYSLSAWWRLIAVLLHLSQSFVPRCLTPTLCRRRPTRRFAHATPLQRAIRSAVNALLGY
jgi:hypothetical protein